MNSSFTEVIQQRTNKVKKRHKHLEPQNWNLNAHLQNWCKCNPYDSNVQMSPKIFGLHYLLLRNKYILINKEKS